MEQKGLSTQERKTLIEPTFAEPGKMPSALQPPYILQERAVAVQVNFRPTAVS